jgi:hypothetical protein
MKHLKTAFFIIGLSCLFIITAFSQTGHEDYCNVFFYPHELEPADVLQDGPHGPYIRITVKTLLVWVDYEPEMDFSHPNYYILISPADIRIVKGEWWPVLNGKTILRDEICKYAPLFPQTLGTGENISVSPDWINIYVFPHELTLHDSLTDGSTEKKIRVYPNTLLIWVDLMPLADFAHPTAYVLISKHGTRVEKGRWWPVLNGKMICYCEQNKIGVVSPFKVMRLLLNSEDGE